MLTPRGHPQMLEPPRFSRVQGARHCKRDVRIVEGLLPPMKVAF